MANPAQRRKAARKPDKTKAARPFWRRLLRRALVLYLKSLTVTVILVFALVGLFAVVDPKLTFYMLAEYKRLGDLRYEWRDLDNISPSARLAVVAAEDAKFCDHSGFDIPAIQAAWEGGARRGASTISQQVAKNVFLWPGRSWIRKGAEAVLTVAIETLWSKQRTLEVYLNVAEFDTGVFGIEAAAQHYFGHSAASLGPGEAARLASVLPDPKRRNPNALTRAGQRRANSIGIGMGTLRADGRAGCFLP